MFMARGINWKDPKERLSKIESSQAVTNPDWDSLYVPATSHTHPQLSCLKQVYQVKIKSGSETHVEIRAVEGNTIALQNILKPGNTSVL